MTLPKLAIIDRDNCLCFASRDPFSPLYYVLSSDRLVLKPGAREAVRLLEIHGIPMVLATKQRCVSKGLITRDAVFKINDHLESLLGIQFHSVYTEEIEENKAGLYREILAKTGLKPSEVVLFDDSEYEINIAVSMGMKAYCGLTLLESVKMLLNTP